MTIPPGRRYSLIAGFLVGCMLVAIPGVQAESTVPPQSDSGSPSTQTASGNAPSSDEEGKVTRQGAFTSFVESSFCMDLFTLQENARTGADKRTINWEEVNRTTIHLSEDEWSDVNRILTDTCQKLDEWRTQVSQAVRGPNGEFPMDPRNDTPEREAKIREVGTQRGVILLGALQSLKQTLGDDSFKKFDDFVYQVEYGGHYIRGAPPKKTRPSQNNSSPNEP
jgi:hypothetical protein